MLLVFVDGIGLGADDRDINPFVQASLPTLREQLGIPLVAIDATLGTDGTPQSGTGQATLLTGVDAVALHGRHFGPWVPARLRDLVREQSVLARARDAGLRAAFANAYPEEVLTVTASHDSRAGRAHAFLRAGPPLAALGAGLLTRHTADLVRGDAVASEITNEGWRLRLGRTQVPSIDARQAGANLARIAAQADVTLFAHYSTDYAGHTQDMGEAVRALETLDAFLGGVVAEAPSDLVTIVASDHGNIEDVTTGHTRNPAVGLVIGDGHEQIASRLHSLLDVAPVVLATARGG